MKCKTCTNEAEENRHFCARCRKRQYRKRYPMRAAYQALRDSAKRRNKEFELSYLEFREFAKKVRYIQRKGIEKYSYHIDRIDEMRGYSIDNIQLITNIQNVEKYVRFTHRDTKANFKVRKTKEVAYDTPF